MEAPVGTSSKTLIVTDLVFHLRSEDCRGVFRLLMRLNGALDHFGVTRLGKCLFIRDKAAFAESMRPVLDLEINHVVMSHGSVVEGEGRARMREAFARLVP